MNNQIYLTRFTIEEIQEHINNGTSVKELLVAVTNMYTQEYSVVTQEFKTSSQLVAQQAELVQFCINNGASLKDAFKSTYEIPAGFIENNLELIIVNQYDSTELLQHISLNPHIFNNPLSLLTKLVQAHEADAGSLYHISPYLDNGAIEFLLNKGMKGDVLFQIAFSNNDKEKQKEMLELAFKYGASGSSFSALYSFPAENYNEEVFNTLIKDYQVSPQDLLAAVVHANCYQYNQVTQQSEPSQELIAKQSELAAFLIRQGGGLQGIPNIPKSFIENNSQLITENKIDVNLLDLYDDLPWHKTSDNFNKIIEFADKVITGSPEAHVFGVGQSPAWIIKAGKLLSACKEKDQKFESIPFSSNFYSLINPGSKLMSIRAINY